VNAPEYGVLWAGYWFRYLRDGRYCWTLIRDRALVVSRMVARAVVQNLPAHYDGVRVAWLP